MEDSESRCGDVSWDLDLENGGKIGAESSEKGEAFFGCFMAVIAKMGRLKANLDTTLCGHF